MEESSSDKIRLILTDDHKIIREGIKSLLASENNISIVGEAYNGESLFELLQHTTADILLLDINMEGKDGIEITADLKQQYPDLKVIILSMLDQKSYVSKALENGARGYLAKYAGRDELSAAINLVASGSIFISPSISLNLLHNKDEVSDETISEQEKLSKRELEVLHLIAEGYTNAEIAEKLFNSRRTIETHRQNILEKTRCKNTAHLIKYAINKGII